MHFLENRKVGAEPYRIVRWTGRVPILAVKYYAWTLADALDAAHLANIFEGRARTWIDRDDAPAWRNMRS